MIFLCFRSPGVARNIHACDCFPYRPMDESSLVDVFAFDTFNDIHCLNIGVSLSSPIANDLPGCGLVLAVLGTSSMPYSLSTCARTASTGGPPHRMRSLSFCLCCGYASAITSSVSACAILCGPSLTERTCRRPFKIIQGQICPATRKIGFTQPQQRPGQINIEHVAPGFDDFHGQLVVLNRRFIVAAQSLNLGQIFQQRYSRQLSGVSICESRFCRRALAATPASS